MSNSSIERSNQYIHMYIYIYIYRDILWGHRNTFRHSGVDTWIECPLLGGQHAPSTFWSKTSINIAIGSSRMVDWCVHMTGLSLDGEWQTIFLAYMTWIFLPGEAKSTGLSWALGVLRRWSFDDLTGWHRWHFPPLYGYLRNLCLSSFSQLNMTIFRVHSVQTNHMARWHFFLALAWPVLPHKYRLFHSFCYGNSRCLLAYHHVYHL